VTKKCFLRRISNYSPQETPSLDEDYERLGRLKPNEKVAIAIDLTDACIRICADGIRTQNPGISEAELVEKLRERLGWSKQQRCGEK
jgi:hypothetical protein